MGCLMEMEPTTQMMAAGNENQHICIHALKIKKKSFRFVGEFSNGQKNGRGVMYYRSGESREGTWTKGKLLGRYEQSLKNRFQA